MERIMQEFIENSDSKEVVLPRSRSPYLLDISNILASYYGLERRSTRVFVRGPNCSMPSLFLSSIPSAEPEESKTSGSKFLGVFTILKRQNGRNLSCNLTEPKTRARTLQEKEQEYYKAKSRIFNESVSSSSTPPPVDQRGILGPYGQGGVGSSSRIGNPMHNPGANLNSNQTGLRPGRWQTVGQPPFIQRPPIPIYDARNFQQQPMQYPMNIQQYPPMLYGQPGLYPYQARASPYSFVPYSSYPVHNPYFGSSSLYNPAYASYMPMPLPALPYTQPLDQGQCDPVYSYIQFPVLPYAQLVEHQPSITDDQLLQQGASIERPSRPPLDRHENQDHINVSHPRENNERRRSESLAPMS